MKIASGYRPGLIADTIRLHMAYYGPVWNFGKTFEAKLAAEIGELFERFSPERDLALYAEDDTGAVVATLYIDGGAACLGSDAAGPTQTRLRWFIVGDALPGNRTWSPDDGAGLPVRR